MLVKQKKNIYVYVFLVLLGWLIGFLLILSYPTLYCPVSVLSYYTFPVYLPTRRLCIHTYISVSYLLTHSLNGSLVDYGEGEYFFVSN